MFKTQPTHVATVLGDAKREKETNTTTEIENDLEDKEEKELQGGREFDDVCTQMRVLTSVDGRWTDQQCPPPRDILFLRAISATTASLRCGLFLPSQILRSGTSNVLCLYQARKTRGLRPWDGRRQM